MLEKPTFNDYKSTAIIHGQVSAWNKKIHILWRTVVVKMSNANLSISFMAIISGQYVSCQIFNGFIPANTQKMMNHSGLRIIFIEKDFDNMNYDRILNWLRKNIYIHCHNNLLYDGNCFEENRNRIVNQ